jgi:endonuclease YncB( thermonuclease family)
MIDTPERGKPGYKEAIEFVNAHFPVGSKCLIKTFKADKYGRWLVEILYDTGSSLNSNLVLNKLAVWYDGGKKA